MVRWEPRAVGGALPGIWYHEWELQQVPWERWEREEELAATSGGSPIG